MPKFTIKYLIVFLLTLFTVLISTPLLQAETALYIPEIQDMLSPYSKQQGILLDFTKLDHQCRERIEKAILKVRQSKNSNELKYFQIEYVEQRAGHVKAIVLHTIKLIKIQNSFLDKIHRDLNRHKAFTASPQVNGMKHLMQMVIFIDSETPSPTDKEDMDKSMLFINNVHQDIETYILASFFMPPSTSDPEFTRQIKNIRTRLYENLKNLRLEFVYLGEKLQQTDTEGKHES